MPGTRGPQRFPWKVATTSAALNTTRASQATRNREWSSSTFRISTSAPPASVQCVMSDCQRSFGISAANRTYELLGRFLGLRGYKAPARQDPPDRRDRRDRSLAVTPGEVVGERVGSGIQTLVRELLAQGNDLVFEHPQGAVRTPPWPAGPRLEAGLPSVSNRRTSSWTHRRETP